VVERSREQLACEALLQVATILLKIIIIALAEVLSLEQPVPLVGPTRRQIILLITTVLLELFLEQLAM
jgi:hypothetical protein